MSRPTRLSRILIVDDHPEQSCMWVDLLSSEGYEVIGCSTVLEALDYSKKHDFGVAVLSFELPSPEAFQLLEQLKQSNQSIGIILKAGSELVNSIKKEVNFKPFASIEKVSDPGELLRQVDRAMRGQLEQYAMQLEEIAKHGERRLWQSNKIEAIGTLAGGIAHDFNNILTAILGYTELALASVPKASRTQRNLQEVLTAGHRAKHLVQQILTFSRQSGHERAPIQIGVLVKEAFKLLRATFPTTIDIRATLNSDATVLADPTQVHQVLVNMCTNAEYAMRENGGILDIRLEDFEVTEAFARSHSVELKSGPHICLTVKDTGLGMSEEVVGRMFDPFFTTKPVGEGSGMGLAVVHGIISSHGGAILVNSVQGEGTRLDIYLPTVTTPSRETPSAQGPIPYGKESILFVDDEEALVRLGEEVLSNLGYSVEVRTSSIEALELFRETPMGFDLVITDQTMPLMTGEALAREMLRIRPELPIILCTGFSHTLSVEKAKTMGIRACLMKPLAIRDLAPIVRHVLDENTSTPSVEHQSARNSGGPVTSD